MTRPGAHSGDSSIVVASWYGPTFHGRRTASGQVFDQERLTAAHKTLPFGTKLRVTNLRNGRSVMVTVNDRGPFVRNRQLDVSLGAARRLGLVQPGTAPVLIEKL
jgi:rare lipoprotein A